MPACSVSFACCAGVHVIRYLELIRNTDDSRILRAASALTSQEYIKKNPNVAVLRKFPEATNPKYPSHVIAALFPGRADSQPEREDHKLGPHLIDQTFRYLDQETGLVMGFTIQDCGTSHLRGEWFEVEYDDSTVLQITARELKEMLANRIE